MATQVEFEEIVKGLRVMINGFVEKGILPCTEVDIIDGKLPPDKYQMFLSFGIDLEVAISCFPMDPIIPLIKLEPNDYIADDNVQTVENVEIKTEYEIEENYADETYSHDFDDNLDFDVKDEAKEEKMKINSDENNVKLKKKKSNDDDWEPPTKVTKKDPKPKVKKMEKVEKPKKKKVERSIEDHPKNIVIKKDCEMCNELINNPTSLRNHCKEAHCFDMIRGLNAKHKGEIPAYASYERLLQVKEALKDHFEINIPPPDFTKEDYEKYDVKEMVDKYVVTDFSLHLKTDGENGPLQCKTCNKYVKTVDGHKEHFVQCHNLAFKCPKENCEINKKKTKMPLLDFIRHFHFTIMNNPLPQLSYPHRCLACDYSTPYIAYVEKHASSNGPHHDNKCPKCSERFFTRLEMKNHMKSMDHEAVMCGFCKSVFPDDNKLSAHKNYCEKKPKGSVVCDHCGKEVPLSDMKHHIQFWHVDDPKPCELCGIMCRNETHLKDHIRWHKRKTVPCSQCGQLVREVSFILTNSDSLLITFLQFFFRTK